MCYFFAIQPVTDFCKANKEKVMHLDKTKRVEAMYNLIKQHDISTELEDVCNDELEDTLYYIHDILEVEYTLDSTVDIGNFEDLPKYSEGDIPF